MADAWAWIHEGQVAGVFVRQPEVDFCVERAGGCAMPLRAETAKVRYADELYQVLKDLTGLAKLAACPLNTYKAAIRNSDELLQQIDREQRHERGGSGIRSPEEIIELIRKTELGYIHSSGCAVLKNGTWLQPEEWEVWLEHLKERECEV